MRLRESKINNVFTLNLILLLMKLKITLLILVIFYGEIGFSQDSSFEIPPTNSRSTVNQKLASTTIEVAYNRPSVKDRKIFGDLVPYDQVWRTGSDASTKISFSTEVSINGKGVSPGTYELFTIPGRKEWVIILQESKSQWGSYSYKEANDILRITVSPVSLNRKVETFMIGFENVTSNKLELVLSWENTMVSIPIEVNLEKTVIPQLEERLAGEGKKSYFRAAMFYFENDLGIDRAAELMAKALEQTPDHLGMLYRQALILEKKGDKKQAIEAAEKSMSLAQEANQELREEYTRLNTELLKRLKS